MPKREKTAWYVSGLHFECVQCANCCSGPGEGCIWVNKHEVELIADFLKMSPQQLREKYLKRLGLRTSIVEHKSTKDCIFLQNAGGQKGCVIYPVRPSQCRNWPFWSSNLASPNAWNQATQKCCGVNRGRFYNLDQIEKIRKQKQWWKR